MADYTDVPPRVGFLNHTEAGRTYARETYDNALHAANRHLAQAEYFSMPDTELDLPADEDKAALHLRFANIYAHLALACQKRPGEKF